MSPEQFQGHRLGNQEQSVIRPNLPLIERNEEGIDLEGLGSLFKHRRLTLGFTLAETARMAFISPSYMRKVENAAVDIHTGRLAQPGPEILQNWVTTLKWDDEPHVVVVFEMAGYRVENYTQGSVLPRIVRDPEQEELLIKVRVLLEAAAQRPRVWRETRDLLEPYLDYIRFRTSGVREENKETTVFRAAETTPTVPASFVDTLPDLLTVSEAADLLRISTLTLKRWGAKGTLVPIRIGSRGDRRYKKEEVLKFLNP